MSGVEAWSMRRVGSEDESQQLRSPAEAGGWGEGGEKAGGSVDSGLGVYRVEVVEGCGK